ncbi:MAG: recombination protein O N-terminal domain-containing protein [Patescibacteria group bacterium]
MREHVFRAVVLSRRPRGWDVLADLLTEELGRIEALAVGGARPLSRLAPHLDFLNLVSVRIVAKNRAVLADAVTLDRFAPLRAERASLARGLELAALVRALSPVAVPDARLWDHVLSSLSARRVRLNETARLLGYDPSGARCTVCGGAAPSYLLTATHEFVCARCRVQVGKNAVVCIT